MQITIDLGSEKVEAELPETPVSFPVAPGGTLYGFLQRFYPQNLIAKGHLYDAQECRAIRSKHAEDWKVWAKTNYTWNQFCREVNHLPRREAEELAGLLLSRDVRPEMRPGGLLGGKSLDTFIQVTGMEPAAFIVTWTRIANRYAWLEGAFQNGIPDPLYDPSPPIQHAGRQVVESVYRKTIEPYLRQAFHTKGHFNTLEVFAQAVLYAFGYLPAKPAQLSDEIWERAVSGLFDERHVLAMMCAYPGDYFNYVALEEQNGRGAFFPTPIEIATMMGEMLHDAHDGSDLPPTPAERRVLLLQEVSDPCVGTGNLIWPVMNDHIRGQFIDINPSMVLASRALFALYAPWFTNSVFCADALAADTNETIQLQKRQYAIDAALAYAGFESYMQRKTEALAESGQLDSLLQKEQQIREKVSHIRARSYARSLQSGTSLYHSFRKLLSTPGEKPGETGPNGHPEPDSRTSPRKTKPALPGQISFFD